ncbi:MAG: peptide ABC transporter substrate-binding protein [Ardenticatenaceae bacterium]|nr:peptide ABC transporter substrate-binding protein [Ardenticatenaceae bacterium]
MVEGQETIITQLVEQTATPAGDTAVQPPRQPVTLDLSYLGGVPAIDPQTTTDPNGINLVENLFAGLTNFNHANNTIEGEAAQSWDVSADGRIWTFHLRDDIFWVQLGETEQVVDGIRPVETVRPVVADDFVYAVQRLCRRDTNAPDAYILFLIDGCEQLYGTNDPTPGDLEAVGAKALDDSTLEITLTKPAGYFLTITSLWIFNPVPPELMEEYGPNWLTQTETPFLTSGPFVPVSGLQTGEQTVLHRNSAWPIVRPGNADIVNILYFDDAMPSYQLWQAKSLDTSPMPVDERETIFNESPQKIQFITEQTVFYLGFNFDSTVFREPTVRRAFSAAIDRDRLAEELYGGLALQMRHLEPPGVMAGPPIDQIGVGYSPDDARRWLAESSFGSCRAMPPITMLITTSDLSLRQAELIRGMWVEELGCDEEQIVIEQVQFGTLLSRTRADAGVLRPDMWELAWASYFPDAQNWFGDLLHCVDGSNRQNRECSEVDSLIRQAAGTLDYADRVLTYREVEDMFFGGEGIFPLAPLYVRGEEILVQSWLNFAPALYGGEQYDTYVINMSEKELERSR